MEGDLTMAREKIETLDAGTAAHAEHVARMTTAAVAGVSEDDKITADEVRTVMAAVRNGSNPPAGYAVNYDWSPPVRKIPKSKLDAINAEHDAARDAGEQLAEDDAEIAAEVGFAERIATQARPRGDTSTTGNAPRTTPPATE